MKIPDNMEKWEYAGVKSSDYGEWISLMLE